ncbi:hypothetical protein [Rhodococcus sp. AG1013]|uniref:hypothetical protein n=1 Tax=unclassified Rhodococcus (in: high G+C Gram-positive bacteria) TaxID=192944 RepID=UPI000E2A61A9|nr:hypothetical protein [Rhodococcus sp. AG1013]RDI21169.1 hypothetical protein DEU38_115111 [Rhodococcus sp. AG1013]
MTGSDREAVEPADVARLGELAPGGETAPPASALVRVTLDKDLRDDLLAAHPT